MCPGAVGGHRVFVLGVIVGAIALRVFVPPPTKQAQLRILRVSKKRNGRMKQTKSRARRLEPLEQIWRMRVWRPCWVARAVVSQFELCANEHHTGKSVSVHTNHTSRI